jgi:hypothetical protein
VWGYDLISVQRLSIEGKETMTPELKKDLLFAALGFGIGFMVCLFYVSL